MYFKKKVTKNLHQIFFAVVNGSKGVDARKWYLSELGNEKYQT
jgi:hypothetical protein